MTTTKNIRIEEYNYHLPEDRIAKFPLPQRDHSKLLVRKDGIITETTFNRLSEYLPEDSLLVFNNTKVIQARMIFEKETGAQIEVFCLEPKMPADYVQSFAQTESANWLCLIGNAKRWKGGMLKKLLPGLQLTFWAEKIESYGESHLVKFSWDNPHVSFAEILDCCGELPIPPYLNRKTEEIDKKTYQTVYSKIKGSVAAPTAGLHFTEDVFQSLEKKSVSTEELTLHVGAGTFKPVKTETIAEHTMHSEYFTIKKTTIEHLFQKVGNVIAVGTTSVRTLESLYYIGEILKKNPDTPASQLEVTQWMPYENSDNTLTAEKALYHILDYLERYNLDRLMTRTQIMIAPDYSFKFVNGIITNFHQPQSTLLLLISAYLKGDWKNVYDYALTHDFRFLSYGDSSLLL